MGYDTVWNQAKNIFTWALRHRMDKALVHTLKRDLRKQVRAQLKAMTAEQQQSQGRLIQQKAIENEVYQRSKHIAIYLHTPGEVPTDIIMKDIFENNKCCYAPRMNGDKLDFYQVYSLEEIKDFPLATWNIPEPPADDNRTNPVNAKVLDLIITPGLAFDEKNGRLGKGKGFYDKFFTEWDVLLKDKQIEKLPYKLAVAFHQQIVEEVPMSEYDHYVDAVVHD